MREQQKKKNRNTYIYGHWDVAFFFLFFLVIPIKLMLNDLTYSCGPPPSFFSLVKALFLEKQYFFPTRHQHIQ